MKAKTQTSEQIREELFRRYPCLASCEKEFDEAYGLILSCYRNGGKLLLAGNGGSAADSDHFTGEMTKSFRFIRALDKEFEENLADLYGDEGRKLAENLEGGLMAIPLTQFAAANSAFMNDVSPESAFAQLVQTFGRKGDVFIGITTSGNSGNILKAVMAARARGVGTVCLTGETGGKCKDLCDICIRVPETETFKVQELHLPVYHALCAMTEAALFESKAVPVKK